MFSSRRTSAVFVKDESKQQAYAEYFENKNEVIKQKKSSGGLLRYLFNCFST